LLGARAPRATSVGISRNRSAGVHLVVIPNPAA
jgi:hypothetical protein